MSYTKGPWRRGKVSDAVVSDNKIGRQGDDCQKHYGGYIVAESIALENIGLIAAAPELLEALEMAVSWLTGTSEGRSIPQVNGQPGEWLQKAKEVIAKAKGDVVNKIKAGDIVLHHPTGETWYILGVNTEKNKVCVAGWPPSIVELSDCELVESRNGISQHEREYRDKEFGLNWEE